MSLLYFKVLGMKHRALKIAVLLITSSLVYANNRVMVTFVPTNNQLSQMSTKEGAKKVRLEQMKTLSTSSMTKLSQAAGVPLSYAGPLAIGGVVLKTDRNLSPSEMKELINKLSNQPGISHVEEDTVGHADAASPETNVFQWDMFNTSTTVPLQSSTPYYGDGFYNSLTNAFSLSGSGAGVTVAVIDTGYVPHTNFIDSDGNWHLVGYTSTTPTSGWTMISDCRNAGTCPFSESNPQRTESALYYADALDLGTYYTQAQYQSADAEFESTCFLINGAESTSSNWHGTHVAGTIIGQGSSNINSGESGIAGGAYASNVLPVRIIGKCGYYTSDLINAITWASGNSILNSDGTTIEAPSTPAQVINLSLGGSGACSTNMQTAITNAVNDDINIVVAAGNESSNFESSSPANCAGVVVVAAADPSGGLASYSNWGDVTITAAGGGTNLDTNSGVLSTVYNSSESYGSCEGSNCFVYSQSYGTSMATPHVSAAIADMLSVNRGLSPTQVIAALQYTATPLSNPCNAQDSTKCVSPTTRLNANAAVQNVYEAPVANGGCTMVEGGDDYGLIFLLLTASGVYLIRRQRKSSK